MHPPETFSAARSLPPFRRLAAAARSLTRTALLSTSALAAAPVALRCRLRARLTRSPDATLAAPLRPAWWLRGWFGHDPLVTWLEDEPSACFLIDGQGSVLAANRAARRDVTAPAALVQILAPLVAEPESHARRLLGDLQRSGAAAHAIGTPGGVYLLSARRVGRDLAAWRLESPAGRDAAPSAEPDLPIIPGGVHRVAAPSGSPSRCLVFDLPGLGGAAISSSFRPRTRGSHRHPARPVIRSSFCRSRYCGFLPRAWCRLRIARPGRACWTSWRA